MSISLERESHPKLLPEPEPTSDCQECPHVAEIVEQHDLGFPSSVLRKWDQIDAEFERCIRLGLPLPDLNWVRDL